MKGAALGLAAGGVVAIAAILFLRSRSAGPVSGGTTPVVVETRKPSRGELAVRGIEAFTGVVGSLAGSISGASASKEEPGQSDADWLKSLGF